MASRSKTPKPGYISLLLRILGAKYSNLVVLSPVRNVSDAWRDGLTRYVNQLESIGYNVYFPLRDTNQHDNTGFRICQDNREAIKGASAIHVAWDGHSEGVLFDLGMAFALKKRIVLITGYFPNIPKTSGKNFVSMIWAWREDQSGDKS